MAPSISYKAAYIVLVVAWTIFWPATALTYRGSNERKFTARDEVRIPLTNRFLLAAVFMATCFFLASPIWDRQLLWVAGPVALGVGVVFVLILLGVGFHAGRLLAGRPMLTRGERAPVFASGPYAWVRHPTYIAVTVAAWLTALMLARPMALYATLCLTAAHLILIFLEERSLRQTDAGAFAAYAARVPMLIPWRRVRAPRTEMVGENAVTTAQALFAEAKPVLSRRAARAAAKQLLKGDKFRHGGAGEKGKRKGKANAEGGQRREQPPAEVEQDTQSRAWQVLQGKQD